MKTRKTEVVIIRLTKQEKEELKENARRSRANMSEYIISKTINKNGKKE